MLSHRKLDKLIILTNCLDFYATEASNSFLYKYESNMCSSFNFTTKRRQVSPKFSNLPERGSRSLTWVLLVINISDFSMGLWVDINFTHCTRSVIQNKHGLGKLTKLSELPFLWQRPTLKRFGIVSFIPDQTTWIQRYNNICCTYSEHQDNIFI